MNVWSKSSVLFASTVVVLLVAIAGVNAIVDPYNMTRWATIKGINGHLPVLLNQSAMNKALGLRREKVETLFLGSSVVDHGFNLPGASQFDGNHWDQTTSDRKGIYDAGIRGYGVDAALIYLHHAYQEHPGIKHVVLGLEWGLFTPSIRSGSPTEPFLKPAPFWRIGYFKYLTWNAFFDSMLTVKANSGVSFRKIGEGLLRLLQITRANAAIEVSAIEQVTLHSAFPINARTVAESRAIYFSIFQAAVFRRQENLAPNSLARRDKLNIVRQIIEFTQRHNIKLTVYASPQHATYWASMKAMGLWQHHLEWLRQLALVTPYFDFSTLADFSEEVDAFFPTDPLHFSAMLGDRLLPILLGQEKSDKARIIDRETIEDALTRRSKGLDDWLRKNPYVASVFSKIRLPSGQIDLGVMLPASVGGSENGMKVVKFAGEYYGLPINQEPFDLRRVVERQYTPMVVADTAAKVVAEIKRQQLRTFELVRVRTNGKPIASDGDASPVFDGNAETYWYTRLPDPENAWIGYMFDAPVTPRRVVLVQSANPVYQHSTVMVQSSHDGKSWKNALLVPYKLLEGLPLIINIPEGAGAATHWRVVGQEPGSPAPKVVWIVHEIEFYTAK